MSCPVGQEHTKPCVRLGRFFSQVLQMYFLVGEISGLFQRVDNLLIYFGADIRTIVQHTVYGAAGYARFVGNSLYRWTFLHYLFLDSLILNLHNSLS